MSSTKVSLERPLLKPTSGSLLLRHLQMRFRKATSEFRALPDFIIAGAQKCGTSSMHQYFTQHPGLVSASIKEVHFFDGGLDPNWDKFSEGEKLYRSYFPFKSTVRAQKALTFEASPCYIFNPLAAERMARLVPNARLVVLLRDPVERAISHYFHELRRGRETEDIVTAFALEDERLAQAKSTGNYKDTRFINLSYKTRGLYAEQLAGVFRHFDREQVLVLEAESFFENPMEIMQQVLQFVGASQFPAPINVKPIGAGGNKTEVPDGVREALQAYFKAPNQALASLLNKPFRWL